LKAENEATRLVRELTSSSNGEFAFQDLPLGAYTVSASHAGFSGRAKRNKNSRCENVPIAGLIIVPLGYADPAIFVAGPFYGWSIFRYRVRTRLEDVWRNPLKSLWAAARPGSEGRQLWLPTPKGA